MDRTATDGSQVLQQRWWALEPIHLHERLRGQCVMFVRADLCVQSCYDSDKTTVATVNAPKCEWADTRVCSCGVRDHRRHAPML